LPASLRNCSLGSNMLRKKLRTGLSGMAIMIYHQRTLVSTAGNDQVSGKWKYARYLERGWRRYSLLFCHDFARVFDDFEDAEKAGLQAAKSWVEHER
jgi:hypothetical protein